MWTKPLGSTAMGRYFVSHTHGCDRPMVWNWDAKPNTCMCLSAFTRTCVYTRVLDMWVCTYTRVHLCYVGGCVLCACVYEHAPFTCVYIRVTQECMCVITRVTGVNVSPVCTCYT